MQMCAALRSVWMSTETAVGVPDLLAKVLEQFLAEAPDAAVFEDGVLLFEFGSARYSITGDGKCVLHIWSDDRNIVRRVVDVQVKRDSLELQVLRFGQAHSSTLEITAYADRRTGVARKSSRARYQTLLERVLKREYPGFTIDPLTNSADLEHSLSSVYTRGVLRAGQSNFAVLGVASDEAQTCVDASLTFAILWLHYLRRRPATRGLVEGLKLFLPPGRAQIAHQRAAHLNPSAAKWQIYELDERSESCNELDLVDTGNLISRLTRAADTAAARERFASSITLIESLVPGAAVTVDSPSEVVFRFMGLEFARARLTPVPGSFRTREAISFGIGGAEYPLDDASTPAFTALTQRLVEQRRPGGSSTSLFYRLGPERWLESLVTRDVRAVAEHLDPAFVYSQVPAFTASDRAMLDVLTCTRDGRLAVLELKANEDIHLPLQGLDYWTRVRWHQQHGEFARNGYFAGRELSSAPPLLYLVAPALRTHPTTDTLLSYLSPRIEWTMVQVDEHWRDGVRVINRKHPGSTRASSSLS
jgi:hypothetical protein